MSAPARALAVAPARSLRILFVVSAHNSLSQRVWVALTELGHRVAVEVVDSGEAIEAAAARHAPELVRSRECFFGPDRSDHEARRRFVHKLR